MDIQPEMTFVCFSSQLDFSAGKSMATVSPYRCAANNGDVAHMRIREVGSTDNVARHSFCIMFEIPDVNERRGLTL